MEILHRFFDLLILKPVLSIVLIFVLLVFLLYLLRNQLIEYAKKKLNLYTETEIRSALEHASDERIFYTKTSEKLTPDVQDRLVTHLKTKRLENAR